MKKLIYLIALTLVLTACGGQNSIVMQSSLNSTNETPSASDDNNDSTPTNSPTLSDEYEYSAVSEPLAVFGMNQERNIFDFEAETELLKISIPFPTLGILQVEGTVPDQENIRYYTNLENQSLTLEISLSEYIRILKTNETLPDGRPIPGVPGGELPLHSFQLPNTSLNMTLYFGKDYFAAFIESDFNLPFNLTKNILSSDRRSIVGVLGWVAAKDSYKGGSFISLRLPRELIAYIANSQ